MTHRNNSPSILMLMVLLVLGIPVFLETAGCSFTKKVTNSITEPIQARIQGETIDVNLASGPETTLDAQDFTYTATGDVDTDTLDGGNTQSIHGEDQSTDGMTGDLDHNTSITSTTTEAVDPAPPLAGSTENEIITRPAYLTSSQLGGAVTVSGLVGQVNGRPIFVDEVLAPIADQLAILGSENTYQDFFRDALVLIKRQLRTVVENELLLAEAERTLDSNQRVGLINFIGEMRKGTIRQYGGTETQAERKLREEQGLTLQEHMDQLRKQILIREQVRKEIAGNIIVSWHDVERYYRNHPKEFNPPASIQLRVIVVKDTDTAKKEKVEAELAAGRPFEVVSQENSDLMATKSGLMSEVKLTDGLENAKVTIWPSVNEAVQTMHEGDVRGPFTVPSYFVWVRVEHYEDGTPISLYDAQKGIEAKLRDRYFQEATAKYFQKLLDRGNYDDFDLMSQSLLAVALDRWAPPVDKK